MEKGASNTTILDYLTTIFSLYLRRSRVRYFFTQEYTYVEADKTDSRRFSRSDRDRAPDPALPDSRRCACDARCYQREFERTQPLDAVGHWRTDGGRSRRIRPHGPGGVYAAQRLQIV